MLKHRKKASHMLNKLPEYYDITMGKLVLLKTKLLHENMVICNQTIIMRQ